MAHRWQLAARNNRRSLAELFGSVRRAFALVERVTGGDSWQTIRDERSQDLLVWLALAQFGRRPRFSALPGELQADVKAFFGTYSRACQRADELLFSAGDTGAVNAACAAALCGKLTPEALYVHTAGLGHLPPILRVYEGCARNYVGTVEGANLVKLHRLKPKVSYLAYPDFDAREREDEIRSLLGLAKRDDANIVDEFFKFAEAMDMATSYKPVFLLSLLDSVDDKGRASVAAVASTFRGFYQARLAAALIVERPSAAMASAGEMDDAAVRRVMLRMPFEKFERRGFLRYARDVAFIEFAPALWRRLTTEDAAKLRAQCERSIASYYAGVADRYGSAGLQANEGRSD